MQITEALERFLTQIEADGRSPHTVAQYQRHVRLLAEWLGKTPIEKVNHERLAEFLGTKVARCRPDGREKKATAMNALRTSLRCFFCFVHAAGYTPTNPARLIRRARCSGPPPRALTGDEEERLVAELQRAPERDRILFLVMLRVGLRLGSALGLDVEDVDLEAAELRLRRAKNDREEVAFLPAALVEDLRAWIGERTDGPLFPGPSGRPVTCRHARRLFRCLLRSAGISRVQGTHVLRHSLGDRLYRQTGDIELVRGALHHRSIASTMVYARCGRDRLRAAMA